VAAPVELVVVDEVVGVGALGPALRGLVELVGEDADGERDRDGLGVDGSASSCRERTRMKWMSSPSIPVMNCGRAFRFPSHVRQS